MPKLDQIQSILKKASGVSAVNWWPKYIYHYTDLTNAIGILKECKIFSRNSVGELANENASKDVIEHTSVEVLDYVRFYFRPKTPTQYRNEGFIPRNQRWSNAHVPIPIFFAFKADKMFEREDVLFSEVSLANKEHRLTNELNELEKFDFRKIYSDGGYKGEKLTPYRHAEIVIPSNSNLENLSNIWCRSNAEYNYLCYLLKQEGIYEKYRNLIGLKENDSSIFYKQSVYISKVDLYNTGVNVVYRNSYLIEPENKNLEITYIVNIGNKRFKRVFYGNGLSEDRVQFNSDMIEWIDKNKKEYIFKILFDEYCVFEGKYSEVKNLNEELPY